MKNIYETFSDEEFERLQKAKEKAEMTWHDFIMKLAK